MPARTVSYLWFVLVAVFITLAALATMDARSQGLALNTFYLAAAATAISLPLGTLLAWILFRSDLPGRRWLLALLVGFLFLPVYLQAAAWQAGFGQQGWYTQVTSGLGSPPLLDRWRGAIWIHAVAGIPWVAFLVAAGLRNQDPEIEEGALLDLSRWQVFWHITLRRSMVPMMAAASWVAVTTAGDITATDLWRLRTYAEELYIGFSLGDELLDAPLAVLPGMVLVFALTSLALVACTQLAPTPGTPSDRAARVISFGGHGYVVLLLVALGFAVVLGVPVLNLAYQAGMQVEMVGDQRVRSWSATKCLTMIIKGPGEFRDGYYHSLLIGGLTSIFATMIAIPLAWLARSGFPRSLPALLIAALSLAVPGPLVGLAIASSLGGWHNSLVVWLYDQTLLAPCLALVFHGLAIPILVLWHAFASLSNNPLHAAASDGAGPWGQFLAVALPQRWLSVLLAAVLVFAYALGDVSSATLLVLPAGTDPLARQIFGQMHYGVQDKLAGICLALMMQVALLSGAAWWIATRAERAK